MVLRSPHCRGQGHEQEMGQGTVLQVAGEMVRGHLEVGEQQSLTPKD